MNMSSGPKPSNFLDQIMKRMDQTVGAIGAGKKVPKVEEELSQQEPADRKKLILRFSQNNFEDPFVDSANEEEILKESKKRCEWKVTLPSAL